MNPGPELIISLSLLEAWGARVYSECVFLWMCAWAHVLHLNLNALAGVNSTANTLFSTSRTLFASSRSINGSLWSSGAVKGSWSLTSPSPSKNTAFSCHHGNVAPDDDWWWRSSSCLTKAQEKVPISSNVNNCYQLNVFRAKFPREAVYHEDHYLPFICTFTLTLSSKP